MTRSLIPDCSPRSRHAARPACRSSRHRRQACRQGPAAPVIEGARRRGDVVVDDEHGVPAGHRRPCKLAQGIAAHRVGGMRGIADQVDRDDASLLPSAEALSPRRLLCASMPCRRKAKATIEAAASSICPRPPTQRKAARTSRAADRRRLGVGNWAPSSGVVGDEVENVVGAFDDGVDLAGGQPVLRVIRFGQHDHAAHAVVQAPLPPFSSISASATVEASATPCGSAGDRSAGRAPAPARRPAGSAGSRDAARACPAPAGRW